MNQALKPQGKDVFRDKIATVDTDGKRIWIFPKMPKGWYYELRKKFSYFLLLLLFGIPFLKVNGDPLLLFNIIERRFIIFGIHFGPQDFYLFVIAMLTFIVFIALFTVVFGRLFCGWVCPQTIFMEMVFRRIEYWIEGDASAQRRLDKAPWNSDKIIKKGMKQLLFFAIAVLVANTFLAYIIGLDAVIDIISQPIRQHLVGFVAMIFFSFAFYFVFSVMREQVCVTICPYGRLQSVLLGADTIWVYYDFVRGEPRGKKKRSTAKDLSNPVVNLQDQLGDCVDCKLCVQVCPTGIDIRDGVQLECINCTACMDACDEVMTKIGREPELIRYDSYNGVKKGEKKIFTPRVYAFSVVLLLLLFFQVFLFSSRADVDFLLLRTPGKLFHRVEEGYISNLYNYQLINKTSQEMKVEFRISSEYGRIRLIGEDVVLKGNEMAKGALFIDIPPDQLTDRSTMVSVQIISKNRVVDEVKSKFLGPFK